MNTYTVYYETFRIIDMDADYDHYDDIYTDPQQCQACAQLRPNLEIIPNQANLGICKQPFVTAQSCVNLSTAMKKFCKHFAKTMDMMK